MRGQTENRPDRQGLTSSWLQAIFSFTMPQLRSVEDRQERARMLSVGLWMLLILGTVILLVDLVSIPTYGSRSWIGISFLLCISLPLMILLRRGHVDAVGISLITLLWMFVTFIAVTSGGIHASVTQGYLIVTFLAGLMGGARYGITVGFLSILAELLFAIFSDMIPIGVERSPTSQWIVNSFYLLSIMVLQAYSVRTLRRAFHRSAEMLSQRQKVEESLMESEERFRAIYDQTDLGVAMADLSGQLSSVNSAFSRMLGYSSAELEGKHFSTFTYEDDLPEELARLREVSAGLRRSYSIEKRHIRKDGTVIPLHVTVSLLKNSAGRPSAYLAIIEDISERYSAEAALRASEERFRVAFDHAGAGIALVDPQGRVLRSNPALSEMIGYSADELVELNFRNFTYSDDIDADSKLFAELQDGLRDRYSLEKRYIHKNGSIVWARLTVSPVRSLDHSREPYSIAIVEDITGKKRTEFELAVYREELEERVRERTEELHGALQVAEAATSARNEFLANVSHELRTPMNAVLGLTHLALGTDLNPRQREYLTKIRGAARDLLGLLNDLLDFSKLEAGRLQLEAVPFYLDRLLDSVIDLVAVRATEKGLHLHVDMHESVPRRIVGDPMRLRQVLINLAGNAVKFTSSGTVTIAVNVLQSVNDLLQLEFSVTDTGPGIPDRLRPHLFQPFRQADGSMTRRYGGTGLGLAICKQLVEQMGGSITLDDSVDAGSRFLFDLPFRHAQSGEAIEEIPEIDTDRYTELDSIGSEELSERTNLPLPGKVLVVEDNEINLQVARELLHSFGLTVDVARNGVEGVQKASSGQYSAILMDLQMPEMDGYEATRQIRQRHLQTPILAMTAHAMESEKKRCLQAGMDDHIPKPVDPDLLYRTLSRWLSLPTRRQPAQSLPEHFEMPGFDVTSAIRRLDGDLPLYTRLLEYFVRDHRDDAERLESALQAGDERLVRRLIHTLRGAASNLSARQVLDVILEMDHIIEESSFEDARLKQPVQELKNAILHSVHAIESVLDTIRPENNEPVYVTEESLTLPVFDSLLARQSLTARQYLEKLRPDLERLDTGLGERMTEAMDRLDYALARKYLAPYISSN